MYLKSVRLQNIKCFEDVTLEFQSSRTGQPDQRNWNVIIGVNGDGKTSLLRAIGACLMDATAAERLLDSTAWVRQGNATGRVAGRLIPEDMDYQIGAPYKGAKPHRVIEYLIVEAGKELPVTPLNGEKETRPRFFSSATILEPTADLPHLFDRYDILREDMDYLKRNAFVHHPQGGWISCGYGPFRRVSGFSSDTVSFTEPMHRRFLTLFSERAALYDCETWLKEVDRRTSRMNAKRRKARLESVKGILLKLLPDVESIEINEEVEFVASGQGYA